MLQKISFMTFNVRIAVDSDPFLWRDRLGSILQIIKRYQPDVLGVQETREHMYEDLRRTLEEYDSYAVSSIPGDPIGQSNALFIRKNAFAAAEKESFMLSQTPDVPASKGWDAACERICSYVLLCSPDGGQPLLHVFNTHLDHVSAYARAQGLRLIAQKAQEKRRRQPVPFVIMGDFNDTPGSPIFNALADKAVSCYSLFPSTEENLLTFHDYSAKIHGQPIDYIYAGAGAGFCQCEIIRDFPQNIPPSDHYPVFASVHFETQ